MSKDKDTGFTCYQVGKPYDKVMEQDGAVLEIHDNVCICSIGLTNVSAEEALAVERGELKLSLSYINGVIFLCVNVSDKLLFDMPFNVRQYDEFPLDEPGSGCFIMPIILEENRTNIIKAMRVIGLYNDFSKLLYELVKDQWEMRLPDYDARLEYTTKCYSPEMFQSRCLISIRYRGVL